MIGSKKLIAALTLGGLMALGSTARATLLPPGGTVVPNAEATDLRTTETLVVTTGGSFTGTGGQLTGTYTAAVYRNASNTLDFVYQVTNTSPSASNLSISATSHFNFANMYTVSASYFITTTAPVDNVPVDATRDNGGTITFDYTAVGGQLINPGQQSVLEILRTNASQYSSGLFSVIGPDTKTLTAFQPTGVAVPEPMTIVSMLAAVPVIGLALARRRRKA